MWPWSICSIWCEGSVWQTIQAQTANKAAQGGKMVNTAEELGHWLRLSLTPGVGAETARRLLAAWGQPEQVFAQSELALCQVV